MALMTLDSGTLCGEGQLVVLTSPLELGTRSQNGRHNILGHMGIPNEWTIRFEIWAFQMYGL